MNNGRTEENGLNWNSFEFMAGVCERAHTSPITLAGVCRRCGWMKSAAAFGILCEWLLMWICIFEGRATLVEENISKNHVHIKVNEKVVLGNFPLHFLFNANMRLSIYMVLFFFFFVPQMSWHNGERPQPEHHQLWRKKRLDLLSTRVSVPFTFQFSFECDAIVCSEIKMQYVTCINNISHRSADPATVQHHNSMSTELPLHMKFNFNLSKLFICYVVCQRFFAPSPLLLRSGSQLLRIVRGYVCALLFTVVAM